MLGLTRAALADIDRVRSLDAHPRTQSVIAIFGPSTVGRLLESDKGSISHLTALESRVSTDRLPDASEVRVDMGDQAAGDELRHGRRRRVREDGSALRQLIVMQATASCAFASNCFASASHLLPIRVLLDRHAGH
jgi:hypothetical protein